MQGLQNKNNEKISDDSDIDPVDLHVGSRLRLRRNLIGMSQDQLGRASNITFQQIQKYERGTNRIAASRLFHLAKLLETDVAWFFDGLSGVKNIAGTVIGFSDNGQTSLESAPQTNNHALQQKETLELVHHYYRITDANQRRKVLELIKSMAEGKE